MLIRKAYKFRLKTDQEIEGKLAQFAGCCRFLWNKALALNLRRLNEKQPLMWYRELAFWLTFWKRTEEHQFLKQTHSQPLQQTLKQLERAFKDGFDTKQPLKRIPKFKRKFSGDSFSYPQGFKFDNRRVYLPKIGWVGFYKSQNIEGAQKNLTVKREADGWYISVQVELEVANPKHSSESCIGIDLGVSRFATLSTGEYYKPLHSFRKHETKLVKLQRNLSRKVKLSNNWRKQKRKIAKHHRKIRNCRNDYIHQITREISKNHAFVFLEDLTIKNMSKSERGSPEVPGRNVKQKSRLNKSILDQAWGIFCNLLRYKLSWLGGVLQFVNPRYTSQKCPKCLYIDPENRLCQSQFKCLKCLYENNADLVGALNILAAGLAAIACQANPRRGRQQEPIGNRKVVLSCVA
jgi:putative transposase